LLEREDSSSAQATQSIVETIQQYSYFCAVKRSKRKGGNMNTFKRIGLVLCEQPSEAFQLSPGNNLHGYKIKKVFPANDLSKNILKQHYPDAEIVATKDAITKDNELDLIVIAAPVKKYADLISEMLQSGKPVQVLS
jgi:hypothetical protein